MMKRLAILSAVVVSALALVAPSPGVAAHGTQVHIHVFNYNDNLGATPPCGGPPFSGVDTMGGNYLMRFPQRAEGGGCFNGTLSVSKNGKVASTTETFDFPGLFSLTIQAHGKLTYPGIATEPGLALVDGHWRITEATGLFAGVKAGGTWSGALDTTTAHPFPLGGPPFFALDFDGFANY